jgi:hypothetical protein
MSGEYQGVINRGLLMSGEYRSVIIRGLLMSVDTLHSSVTHG